MDVIIVADQGSHLLIGHGDRFAIVERRNGRLYNCHDGERTEIPLADIAAVATVLDDSDWIDKATAQAAFDDIVAHGTHLGQTMR